MWAQRRVDLVNSIFPSQVANIKWHSVILNITDNHYS